MALLPPPPGRAIIPGEVRYLLEVWRGAALARSSEFPLVASFTVREGPALNLSHTFGTPHRTYNGATGALGQVLDGFRERTITLSGNSGVDHRLGYDAQGARRFASGFDVFQDLRGFLAGFAKEHAEWEATNEYTPPSLRTPEPTLVVRALREGEVYSCDVTDLNAQRSGIGNFWGYTATIRAWGPPPALLDPGGLSAFFGSIVAAAKTATAFVDSMTAYVAYAREVTDQAGYVGGTLLEPINAVGRLAEQVGGFAEAVQRVSQLPQQFVNAVFDAADDGVQATADLAEAFTFGTTSEDVEEFRTNAAMELGEARNTALAFLGARGVKASDTASALTTAGQLNAATGSQAGTQQASLMSATIGAFDTVEGLVQRLFGGLDKLADVLTLNGMPDPWTLNTGAPVSAGTVLLVPGGAQGLPSVGAVVGPDDLYGTDLALDLADGSPTFGDLLAPGDEPDDFALATGTANLDRMLAVRLTTSAGDYGAFPSVGLALKLGQSTTQISRSDVASRTTEQLLRDPRIRRVGPIDVTVTNGDRYTIAVDVFPVVGDGVQVAIPVGG